MIKSVSKVLGQMWALLALRGVPGLLRQTLCAGQRKIIVRIRVRPPQIDVPDQTH